jgi:hypothetical protein
MKPAKNFGTDFDLEHLSAGRHADTGDGIDSRRLKANINTVSNRNKLTVNFDLEFENVLNVYTL